MISAGRSPAQIVNPLGRELRTATARRGLMEKGAPQFQCRVPTFPFIDQARRQPGWRQSVGGVAAEAWHTGSVAAAADANGMSGRPRPSWMALAHPAAVLAMKAGQLDPALAR